MERHQDLLACDQGFINSLDNHEGALSLQQKSSLLPSKNLLLHEAHYPHPQHTQAQPLLLTEPSSIYLVPWLLQGVMYQLFPKAVRDTTVLLQLSYRPCNTAVLSMLNAPLLNQLFGHPNRISLYQPLCLELK